jgi:putative spermidine/putrescine transport system ATP-binding protein
MAIAELLRKARSQTMMDKSAAELISVTKSYGQSIAVDDISLKIPGASYTCLLGPSGMRKIIDAADDRGP